MLTSQPRASHVLSNGDLYVGGALFVWLRSPGDRCGDTTPGVHRVPQITRTISDAAGVLAFRDTIALEDDEVLS